MNGVDMEKARRETLRWHILIALNSARPLGASEGIVLSAIQAIPMDVTRVELRKELDYLEERDLVHIEGKHTPQWHAKLSRYGVDVTEYTVDCKPGIARPEKWW